MNLTSYSKEDIRKETELSNACEIRNYDKMYYSNPYDRHIEKMNTFNEILDILRDHHIERYDPDSVIINDKWILTLRNRRWRVKNKNKWYVLQNS